MTRPENVAGSPHMRQAVFWKRYAFAMMAVFVAILAVVAAYIYAQRPAAGVIKPAAEIASVIDQEAAPVPKTFSGTYVSFTYGSAYAMRSHDVGADIAGVILETAYLVETAEMPAVSKKISLTVRSLPIGNLEDDPDYRMREMTKKRYAKSSFSKNGVEGTAFESVGQEQSFEKSFFIWHGGLLAIIVMTAPAFMDADLEKEADAVAGSLSWVPR